MLEYFTARRDPIGHAQEAVAPKWCGKHSVVRWLFVKLDLPESSLCIQNCEMSSTRDARHHFFYCPHGMVLPLYCPVQVLGVNTDPYFILILLLCGNHRGHPFCWLINRLDYLLLNHIIEFFLDSFFDGYWQSVWWPYNRGHLRVKLHFVDDWNLAHCVVVKHITVLVEYGFL